jgi:hypothetical protein
VDRISLYANYELDRSIRAEAFGSKLPTVDSRV